ncbi:MAG TPA: PQQ-binding-like beta-propeller repeat protein [Methanotrichaceae archaeon]|nr:PQQ-binding-like beta-propeller repeat protein [Methanotrichaceae archaeon]
MYSGDWPLPNKDYSSTRAATSSTISSSNINSLKAVWSYAIPGGAASNPLIFGDTVYFQDLNSNIVALSIKNGSAIWTKRYDLPVLGPNGVAVGFGKVFAAAGYYRFVALDASSGRELWSINLSNKDTVGITIQPRFMMGWSIYPQKQGAPLAAQIPLDPEAYCMP